jgi:hypothetical protein
MRLNSRKLSVTMINPSLRAWTANLYVMRTAGRSGPLQLRPNLTVMGRRFGAERQHVETRHEIFDRGQSRRADTGANLAT